MRDNAVLPVLLLNTIFSTVIFSPFLINHITGSEWFARTVLDTAPFDYSSKTISSHPVIYAHMLVILKACIVLSSWIMGYFGLKHLPLTLVGPINATRPVLVLVGAMVMFEERLNIYQWTGVLLTILSIYVMSRAGKKENIDFKSNRWIWCVAGATIMGAVSGLYDKHIMNLLRPMFVQSWFNFYQMIIMSIICMTIWYPKRQNTTPLH